MKFHDICSFDGERGEFHSFENEAMDLPGFDRFKNRLMFVSSLTFKGLTEEDKEQAYQAKVFRVDGDMPDALKPLLGNFVDSRNSFFQVVRFVLDSAVANKLFYFYSFSLKTVIDVPKDVEVKSLSREQLMKYPQRPLIIVRAEAKWTPTVVEPKQEVVKTEEPK